jgi:DNA-binding transcriptional MocR family regulator
MDHLYESLARDIGSRIERGQYAPGDRLPGVRRISAEQRVSVATVISAYRALEDQGVVEARERSGFFVRRRPARDFPEPQTSTPGRRPAPVSGQQLVLRLIKAATQADIVQLATAVPAQRFLPTRALERAIAGTIRRHRQRIARYESAAGAPELRRQIARRMSEVGCTLSPEDIVITTGCQEALMLALRAVTGPRDIVALESPTYYGLLQVVESLGLKALEIPTHPREGISVEALEHAIERWPVRACVVIPNFSNPMGFCMPESRRRDLVALLARKGVALIEDDVYGDIGFGGERPGACLSYPGDGDVFYCSSFSKTLSPGMRIGWIVPGRHRDSVEYLKFATNAATATVPQLALAEYLDGGSYTRHLRRVRGEYARAVSRMIDTVAGLFPEGTRVTRPEGGFVIWVELPPDVDSVVLTNDALDAGVSIAPGPIFSATGKYGNFIRLSCACEWDARVERAVATVAGLARAQTRR